MSAIGGALIRIAHRRIHGRQRGELLVIVPIPVIGLLLLAGFVHLVVQALRRG
jgi:hypothetical protein